MACALACETWDHAEKLTMAAPDYRPSLIADVTNGQQQRWDIRTRTLGKTSLPEYGVYEGGISDR